MSSKSKSPLATSTRFVFSITFGRTDWMGSSCAIQCKSVRSQSWRCWIGMPVRISKSHVSCSSLRLSLFLHFHSPLPRIFSFQVLLLPFFSFLSCFLDPLDQNLKEGVMLRFNTAPCSVSNPALVIPFYSFLTHRPWLAPLCSTSFHRLPEASIVSCLLSSYALSCDIM